MNWAINKLVQLQIEAVLFTTLLETQFMSKHSTAHDLQGGKSRGWYAARVRGCQTA
jgi:hypothetical protein